MDINIFSMLQYSKYRYIFQKSLPIYFKYTALFLKFKLLGAGIVKICGTFFYFNFFVIFQRAFLCVLPRPSWWWRRPRSPTRMWPMWWTPAMLPASARKPWSSGRTFSKSFAHLAVNYVPTKYLFLYLSITEQEPECSRIKKKKWSRSRKWIISA